MFFFASVTGFLVTSALKVPPTIPAVVFLASLVVFYVNYVGKWAVTKFRGGRKMTFPISVPDFAPLISIEGFFNGPKPLE